MRNVTYPSFVCRKHTIQRMSRLSHLPSWVGKTYECSNFRNMRTIQEKNSVLIPLLLQCHIPRGLEANKSDIQSLSDTLLVQCYNTQKSFSQHEDNMLSPKKVMLDNFQVLLSIFAFSSRFILNLKSARHPRNQIIKMSFLNFGEYFFT